MYKRQDIESLFAQLHALPSIPKVAQELIQQFDNPSSSLESVARNIERDPVIAAKVLRLANSPRFRGSREAVSVEDAAMRLGFNTLRTLVPVSYTHLDVYKRQLTDEPQYLLALMEN